MIWVLRRPLSPLKVHPYRRQYLLRMNSVSRSSAAGREVRNLSFSTLNIRRGVSLWETCSVQLSVQLPRDIAAQAEAVQEADPEFLSRVVLYGLTRRSIYEHLRKDEEVEGSTGVEAASILP